MIKFLMTRLAAWRQQRETTRELSLMSDRELADLGISRGDIPFVADGSAPPADETLVAVAAGKALIGPAWAAHAPTSLAA